VTRSQFALAARADEKWVENTARTLGHRLRYSVDEARWLGLVHVLTRDLGMSIQRASTIATAALQLDPATRALRLRLSERGEASVALDLARYHSAFAAALSAALNLGGPRRAGRPTHPDRRDDPVAVATEHGIDMSLVRSGLRRTRAERLRQLDANAAFLRSVRRAMPSGRQGDVG